MPTVIDRIPDSPPVILPLPAGINRTLWSIMIPIYNGSVYLREAIESVLIQDRGISEMQIEVVDDCSTDADVKKIVEEVGKGRVSYYRQEQNVGSLRNFETCINRSTGYYIHLLHCDDKVKDGFYETMTGLFKSFPEAAAAFCAHDSIDAVGKIHSISEPEANEPCVLPDLLFTLAVRQPIQYVSMVVKREIYEELGAFYGVTYGEDWEMWARIAKNYPIAYTPEALAQYRDHFSSISTNSFLGGKNLRDMSKVINIISSYLPAAHQKKLNRIARKQYVTYSIENAERLYHKTDFRRSPYRHLRETLSFYNDAFVTKRVFRLLMLIWFHPLKEKYFSSKKKEFTPQPSSDTVVNDTISVIIPCYNQGKYLSTAIESVLNQSYQKVEIIVIDDGSKDDTAKVSLRYPYVKYIYQNNQGLSAARNTGIINSSGEFLVFLDADDWLLPEALITNLTYLKDSPEIAFVHGGHKFWLERTGETWEIQNDIRKDHYLALLERNYIGMHASVMYRRSVFNTFKFDVTLKACEDYDLYLKIARTQSIYSHTSIIAVYQLHDSNMSGNSILMLKCALRVLKRQKRFLKSEPENIAYKKGVAFWKSYYGEKMFKNIFFQLYEGMKIDRKQLEFLKEIDQPHYKEFKQLYYKQRGQHSLLNRIIRKGNLIIRKVTLRS